jgi:DNA invertase Pin-like site-specific DNA recombinase
MPRMTITTNGLRMGAYHRVSDANGRDREADNVMTERDAFEQMEAWAKFRGNTIAKRYCDWDKTGSKMSRPGLDAMLADLDAGVIDGIVVAQVDRLSRADVGDALSVVRQIAGEDEERPRPLVLLDLGLDPTTEVGELALTMLLAFARMQWRRYKRTWNTAQSRAIKRGVWIGQAPFGYRHTVADHDRNGRPITGPLEPVPATADVVREAFRIGATDGLHAVMAYLKREAPERRWRTDEARKLLRCRAYLGELVGGEPGPHKPLTTPDLFAAAQTKPQSRRSNGDYPLSGLALCGGCGGEMKGGLQTLPTRPNGQPRQYRRMRCADCNRCSINADNFETYVREYIRPWLADDEFVLQFVGGDLRSAEAELEQAKAERKRFAKDTRARRLMGDEDWYAALEQYGTEVVDAQHRYDEIATRNAQVSVLPGPDQLDTDSGLIRAVNIIVDSIVVTPGRGTLTDRIAIDFADGDDDAGVLAA